jgi:precorrin-4/cobalt-precorrin-4 C11-methyltransferase
MMVYLVGAGPGDPDLLTRKGFRLIRSTRCCIYAGSLVGQGVLDLIPKKAERHDSAVLSLEQIVGIVKEARDRNLDVLRLHSGDPSIYGAMSEQINAFHQLGVGCQVVPGVSSFQASAAALQVELTAPEVAQTIILTRASGRTPLPESQELARLAPSRATLCLFLSVQKIESIALTLREYYGPRCPAAVVHRASLPDERIITGNLEDIAEKTIKENINKTAMILVGEALAKEAPASKLYDRDFSHGYRTSRSK